MANTLIPIQTYTLASSASSITFSNIPQNYSDLKLVVSARTLASTNVDAYYVRFNDSSSGYSNRTIYGESNGYGSFAPNISYAHLGYAVANSGTSNTFSNSEILVQNYASTDNKTCIGFSVTETNATTYQSGVQSGHAAVWANSSAITKITITVESTNSFATNSTFTLYGISNGVKATGGTLTVAGGYAYHTFTSTGSFLPNQKIKGAEILCVAGGGGGGSDRAGGGGAGGVLYSSSQTLNAGTSYTALVGSGGAAGASGGSNAGVNGTNSVLNTTIAIGGGYGSGGSGGNGGAGGSGGGAGGSQSVNFPVGGTATSGQGNAGGNGVYQPGNNNVGAGGGGGAGGAGTSGTAVAGAGGVGTTTYTTWHAITGTGVLSGGLYYIAAGGGGGANSGQGSGSNGAGGTGGGGAGGTSGAGTAGTANSGGGGGGGSNVGGQRAGAAGGSGLIIVRYPLS